MYKSIVENGNEYLVFESCDYKYFNRYSQYYNIKIDASLAITDNVNILPKKYNHILYLKFIINFGQLTETYYFYKNLLHNSYGPAFIRNIQGVNIINSYYLYDELLDYEEWGRQKYIEL